MRLFYFFLLSVSQLLFGQQDKQKYSDIWIIENPSELIIYNQYEQSISENEKSELPAYSAWRILDDDYILSDQFTHAIKATLNRELFYIQLTEDGDLVNGSKAGKIDIIKGARILEDTVQVSTNGKILLKVGNTSHIVSEEMLVERLFSYRKRYYARDISRDLSGWVEVDATKHWESYQPDNNNQALEMQLYRRIDNLFSSYNSRLDKLFKYLNDHYGISNPSPQWIAERSPSYLKYVLSPKKYRNKFTDSQKFLIQELNDLLYGSTYHLLASEDQIIIFKSSRK